MKIRITWAVVILCLIFVVDFGRAIQKGSIIGKKCEYILREKSFDFTSPGYPEFYPNKAKCKWTIIAEAGYHIHLTIINVKIEESKHCEFDAVTIYDGEGDTAIPIRKLCGTQLPENLQSVSNVFTIVMETDGYGNGEGFQMKYTTIPACMMASLGDTGELKSPGYPLGYPDGISCNFYFPLLEVGKFIHIYFEDFQLEEIQHYECFDHLSIITMSEKGEEKIEGQFCGTTLKEKSLCFKTGQLSMRLVTDRMWNTRGFKVSYLITDDMCSEKDNISLLIDDTVHTVELTDIQVLQQLLDKELNGGALTSSVVANENIFIPTQSTLRNATQPTSHSSDAIARLYTSTPYDSQIKTSFKSNEMIIPLSIYIIQSTTSLTETNIIESSSVSNLSRMMKEFPLDSSPSNFVEVSTRVIPTKSMSNFQNLKLVSSEIEISFIPNSNDFIPQFPDSSSYISSFDDSSITTTSDHQSSRHTTNVIGSSVNFNSSYTTSLDTEAIEQISRSAIMGTWLSKSLATTAIVSPSELHSSIIKSSMRALSNSQSRDITQSSKSEFSEKDSQLFKSDPRNELQMTLDKKIQSTTIINRQTIKSVYLQNKEFFSQSTDLKGPITPFKSLPAITSSPELNFQHGLESSFKEHLSMSTNQPTPLESLLILSKVSEEIKQQDEGRTFFSLFAPSQSYKLTSSYSQAYQSQQLSEEISKSIVQKESLNVYTITANRQMFESSMSETPNVVASRSCEEASPLSTKVIQQDSTSIIIHRENKEESKPQTKINQTTSITTRKTQTTDLPYNAPTLDIPTVVQSTIQPLISTSSAISGSEIIKTKGKCKKYLKFELHAGQLPLNRLTIKAKKLIQNAFQSHVLDVHEVAWPHDSIVGKRGIMSYGSLLTTNNRRKFLLRVIQQNHIHFVEITEEIMDTYNMEKLMLLPSENRNETVKEYLQKISATIKVSLLFC